MGSPTDCKRIIIIYVRVYHLSYLIISYDLTDTRVLIMLIVDHCRCAFVVVVVVMEVNGIKERA